MHTTLQTIRACMVHQNLYFPLHFMYVLSLYFLTRPNLIHSSSLQAPSYLMLPYVQHYFNRFFFFFFLTLHIILYVHFNQSHSSFPQQNWNFDGFHPIKYRIHNMLFPFLKSINHQYKMISHLIEFHNGKTLA